MERRALLVGTLAVLVAPVILEAQQADKVARIGVLSFGAPEPFREGFKRALFDLGYVEGRNIVIEYRWADGCGIGLLGGPRPSLGVMSRCGNQGPDNHGRRPFMLPSLLERSQRQRPPAAVARP